MSVTEKLWTPARAINPRISAKKAESRISRLDFRWWPLGPYNGNIHAIPISNYSSKPATTRNSGPTVRLLEPHQEVLGWRGACDCSRRRFDCRVYPRFRDCRCVGNIVNDWSSHHSCEGSPGALKTSKRLITKLSVICWGSRFKSRISRSRKGVAGPAINLSRDCDGGCASHSRLERHFIGKCDTSSAYCQ
jgi:hypothetical protein